MNTSPIHNTGTLSSDYDNGLKAFVINSAKASDMRRRTPSEGGNVGSKYIKGAEVIVDNRWVVPYSPYFLLKYRSHINVENCNAVQAVKYLFLYHFKGEDMVTIEDEDMYDEVKKFSTRRYVSSCFAYWRLAFPDNMVLMNPPVKKLKIHLENQQRCAYGE